MEEEATTYRIAQNYYIMLLTAYRGTRFRKLTFLLFTVGLLFIAARGMAQKITISQKNISFDKVLREIRKQTGFNYVCTPEWAKEIGPSTINVKDVSISEVLDICLKGKNFSYNITDKTITIYRTAGFSYALAPVTVSGIVRNSHNQPIDGASIVIQRTREGTITNAKGAFTLKNIKPYDTLNISMIGYTSRVIPIPDEKELTIILKDANNQLDEVVKTAYGRTSQRFATGNISKVTSAEIEKQPVMNPLMALQGRVPGMVVTPTSGFASSPVRMEIRGLNSLNKSVPSDPLFIIDGVPLTVSEIGGVSTLNGLSRVSNGFGQAGFYNAPAGGAIGQSPLFGINPDDIESIEILKDADATAVYGSRGSNGVVLITTKKGKPGATKFDFHIDPPFLSIGKNTRYVKMLNTQQYLQMRREALQNDKYTPTLYNAPDLLYWDTTRYTDWQRQTNGGTARNLNVSAGISGGNELTSFRINSNYTRQTNTTNISGATQRATLGANVNSTTRDQKFSFSLSTNFAYSYVDIVAPVLNPWFAPNAPSAFDKEGNPNWEEWDPLPQKQYSYPFGPNLSPANPQSTTNLTSSFLLNYKPFKGLVLSAILGYNFAYNATSSFMTIASQSPFIDPEYRKGNANFGITQNSGWTINPQITYNLKLGRSDIELSWVATEQYVSTNISNLLGYNYISDILLGSINNAPFGSVTASSAAAKSKNASFVGQINYIYDRKYIVNLTGTRQGSSKFGPENKYGSFGSAGVGWIVSEEQWMKKTLPSFISFLKFRGSYGLTGSDGVADYQYLPLWQFSPGGGYNGQQILIPSVRPNQKYKWENNTKLEAAANIGFLDDRINFSAAYYRNRVSNQLTNFITPLFISSTPISGIVTNIPLLLQNSGWEGVIDAKLITKLNFNLSANFNISRNKNKLLSFPDLENSPYVNQYALGQSINTVYLFHFLGIDPLNGYPAFEDYNHDGIITSNGLAAPPKGSDDRQIVYDLQPRFTGGAGITGNYKKLGFSAFFSYKKQIGKNVFASLNASPGTFNANQPQEVFDNSWRKPGDNAKYPGFHYIGGPYSSYYYQSEGAYTDASYIRLTNLSFSYPLPEMWVKKIGMKNLRVAINAQKVFVITRYKGGDPEAQSVFPPPKLYTFRIDYSF